MEHNNRLQPGQPSLFTQRSSFHTISPSDIDKHNGEAHFVCLASVDAFVNLFIDIPVCFGMDAKHELLDVGSPNTEC